MKIHKYKSKGKTLYAFRASLGTDINGKQRRIYKSGYETKKEAELAYLEITKNKKPRNSSNITFAAVCSEWLSKYQLEVSPSTHFKTYRLFANWVLPNLGEAKIRNVQSDDIQALAVNIAKSVQNTRRYISYIKRVFDYAVQQKYISDNPCTGIAYPKTAKRKTKADNYYTKDELMVFLTACKEQLPYMWYVFFRTLAYTGMRRGELIALQWDCVDTKAKTITICRTLSRRAGGSYISDLTKTETGERTIPIDNKTLGLMLKLKGKSKFVFSNTRGSFCTSSLPIHKLKSLKGVRYVTPHGLRHTHCALLFSAGVPLPEVQQRLGHKDIKTTIDIYNHIYPEDKAKALDLFLGFMNTKSQ